MTTLDDLITRANNVLAVLENLLEGDAAGTPIAETGDAPTYDEATGLWIFAQAIANADGEYLGIYRLPLAALCSVLSALDIIAFTAPQAPNTPARILPCGADPLTGWTNLPALVDLEGQEVNGFSIRSATAFEVRLKVGARPTCADKWELTDGTHGEILSRTGNTLTMNAGLQSNGVWYAIIKTVDISDCCSVSSIEAVEGAIAGIYSIDCGTPYSEPAWHGLDLQNNCVNRVQIQGTAQFTVRFTFQDCS